MNPFCSKLLYILGYLSLKGVSPNHKSSHNKILLPSPTHHMILFMSHLPFSPRPHTFLRTLHHMESPLLTLQSIKEHHKSYFDFIISTHKHVASLLNLQAHFPSKTLLKQLKSFIPNSSTLFELQMVFQLIQFIFLPCWP